MLSVPLLSMATIRVAWFDCIEMRGSIVTGKCSMGFIVPFNTSSTR